MSGRTRAGRVQRRTGWPAHAALAAMLLASAASATVYVSPTGDDRDDGSAYHPVASLAVAIPLARGDHAVVMRSGTYHLGVPVTITPADSGTADAPLTISAEPGGQVMLSGATPLRPAWRPHKGGIYQSRLQDDAPIPADFDALYVNGRQQVMARYPNFDPNAVPYNGVAADAVSPARLKTWAHPETGILNAMHGSQWGDMHYRITGVDARGNAVLAGGTQMNRPSKPHPKLRFVENVFEELDAPGEWFFDRPARTLYLYPQAGVDLPTAAVEASGLQGLLELRGTAAGPVQHIRVRGITFARTARTYLEPYDPILLSDWSIHRGSAVYLNDCEDCQLADCDFADVGGNAVFIDGHDRGIVISGSRFVNVGASCVCFVGSSSAVRRPTHPAAPLSYAALDQTPGPADDNYPADCTVTDCLMHHFGTVEKQVAGVEIDIAARVTVDHCSIYDCPRAGLNIGDGCFGGHVIRHCDVFDTVRETGDHGSFNAWGRDRYWELKGLPPADADRLRAKLALLDAVEPTTIVGNRFRCDHGWDIDLDDGSSNYRITGNLCLHGGLKNREGFARVDRNNVLIDYPFYPQVWYPLSGDVFEHNVVAAAHRPALMRHWDATIDDNFFTSPGAMQRTRDLCHTDAHSVEGDPQYVSPATGNYNPGPGSLAASVGFVPIPTNDFGVRSPRLAAEAAWPSFRIEPTTREAPAKPAPLLDGTVRSMDGIADRSSLELPVSEGLIVVTAPPAGMLGGRLGLKPYDVISAVNDRPVATIADFTREVAAAKGAAIDLTILHGQRTRHVTYDPKG